MFSLMSISVGWLVAAIIVVASLLVGILLKSITFWFWLGLSVAAAIIVTDDICLAYNAEFKQDKLRVGWKHRLAIMTVLAVTVLLFYLVPFLWWWLPWVLLCFCAIVQASTGKKTVDAYSAKLETIQTKLWFALSKLFLIAALGRAGTLMDKLDAWLGPRTTAAPIILIMTALVTILAFSAGYYRYYKIKNDRDAKIRIIVVTIILLAILTPITGYIVLTGRRW